MAGSIKNWPRLMKRIFEHLKPGGWAEFSEWDTDIKSQDNSIPKDYKPQEMLDLLGTACEKIGRPIGLGVKLQGLVAEAGFTNIGHKALALPVGIWPKDKKMVGILSSL
jgi:hypothetical protein